MDPGKDRPLAHQDKMILEAQNRIAHAHAITVLTGAGISADSGVPTFRGEEGLWRNFKAEDLATPEAFSNNPRLVWEWYDWRRKLIASKMPNPAHLSLVELEKKAREFTLITQNVDGLHLWAGTQNLIELHGNIWQVRCTQCDSIFYNLDVPIDILPQCSQCQGLIRPHIVWFGEALNPVHIRKTQKVIETCDIMLVIGTSGMVQPAASFAGEARSAGAFVIEINLAPTLDKESVDVSLQGRAKDIVPMLLGPV